MYDAIYLRTESRPMSDDAADSVIQIDIISDVMCPWCIVGFRQLEQALGATGMGARVVWHPFELNPNMPPQGQNLTEHIVEKYGSTPEQSAQSRNHLQTLGKSLGIDFVFSPNSRIVNSFAAHQLLDFALSQGLQHPLKLALFQAYFSDQRDISDVETLLDIAQNAGLDHRAAAQVLDSGAHVRSVREKQAFWTERGISGVPSIVFDRRYLVTGAQGVDTYAQLLQKVAQGEAA